MRKRIRKRPMSEINVVPYIDVMLVLLVIFMVTAPLITEGVKVDLPQAEARPLKETQSQPIEVTVDKEGRYYVNRGEQPNLPVTEDTLLYRVNAALKHQPNAPVIVRGDSNVDYGSVVYVMALLKEAGAESVGLMTETPRNR